MLHRKPRFLILAVAVTALLAFGGATALATTSPTTVIRVQVKITDKDVTLSRDSARRGWGVIFIITNAGKKPHRITIGGASSPVMRPGAKLRFNHYLEYRGLQPIEVTMNRAGKSHSTVFTVS